MSELNYSRIKTVRCKFACHFKEDTKYGVNIHLGAVYGGSDENAAFFKATPSGTLQFNTVNPHAAEMFETGREYYLDISLVE